MKFYEIGALRRRLGLTQAEFAERYQIPRRTLQAWENGRYDTTGASATLLKLIAIAPKIIADLLRSARAHSS